MTRRSFGGDIVLDETTLTLRNVHTGESVRLGDKEFRILEYFLRNRGRILTREQLVQRVWGYDSDAEYNKDRGLPHLHEKEARVHRIGCEDQGRTWRRLRTSAP